MNKKRYISSYLEKKREIEEIEKMTEYITLAIEVSPPFLGYPSSFFERLEEEIYNGLLKLRERGIKVEKMLGEEFYSFLKERVKIINDEFNKKYKDLGIDYRSSRIKEEILRMFTESF